VKKAHGSTREGRFKDIDLNIDGKTESKNDAILAQEALEEKGEKKKKIPKKKQEKSPRRKDN